MGPVVKTKLLEAEATAAWSPFPRYCQVQYHLAVVAATLSLLWMASHATKAPSESGVSGGMWNPNVTILLYLVLCGKSPR